METVVNGEIEYITQRVPISGNELSEFFSQHPTPIDERVKSLLEKTVNACKALYWTENGPLVMLFQLKVNEKSSDRNWIATLTNDRELGALFQIHGIAYLRVLRCPKHSFKVLEQYVADKLSG